MRKTVKKRVFVGWCYNGVADVAWKRYALERKHCYLYIKNHIVNGDCHEFGWKMKKVKITIEEINPEG